MNRSELEKLSKAELIDLLLNKMTSKKPIPTPRRSVKQLVTDYEQNIILPPLHNFKIQEKLLNTI